LCNTIEIGRIEEKRIITKEQADMEKKILILQKCIAWQDGRRVGYGFRWF